ncbi:hypothetical protein M0804_009190 [Polistes exclamans]|nr:hypothetical protein M0804_009190 [Polistes exclamans]
MTLSNKKFHMENKKRIELILKNNNYPTSLIHMVFIKINSIFTKLKDKVDKLEQSNLVYKIPCVCDKCYIGQTKQKLKKRLEQHKNDCKSINAQKSNITALAEHHFITGHNFKFDETDILDKEDNWYKRNISEMYHITNNNTVNYRTDTNNLNNIYNEILKFNYHNKTH